MPLSIVLPAYNAARFLAQLLAFFAALLYNEIAVGFQIVVIGFAGTIGHKPQAIRYAFDQMRVMAYQNYRAVIVVKRLHQRFARGSRIHKLTVAVAIRLLPIGG